ncbi:aspartate--tRNA(Asn) ligase [Candidatus Aquiluna sp. UB-MaderosW2red]|jgi:aspartyl-tRNA synthetase|uniref:aspartate--tRNA(Asn) ligase n=1 Tax=Candidatus Aquiluna sp. UB-MaderosW2red TaxID=1855377 RepID=UPI000875BEB8|nr:aspartate--tRNA(Asn) ligase [Candidatus Aquiluna sp. UB-MaderosW2red]SCX02551.1 aspartyl-tRNA synthetase [Candidatus Aquiluna sp. UB-MaderosW2red]
MQNRSLISQLQTLEDGPVKIGGWVETLRDQKRIQFIIIRDESGSVQVTYPRPQDEDALADLVSSLASGSFVEIEGNLKHDERVKLGGIEILLTDLTLVSQSLPDSPIAEDTSIDKRLDWRFLDMRRPELNLMLRIQTTLEQTWREIWLENDFIEIHSPKLMGSPSESHAELFKLEYFDTHAYLAQSPQFYKQMAMSAGLGKIFEIGSVFRADPSFTSRHATEFVSVDMEMSWIDSHQDVMAFQEQLLSRAIAKVKEKFGAEIEKLYGIDIKVPTIPFPRIPLAEAHQIVEKRGYKVPRQDGDLDPEGERQIAAHVAEELGHEFVFLTDYPKNIRPFYHMRHEDDDSLTKSYDLVFKGTEITTGAQREHRVEVLEKQILEKGLELESLGFYLDFFRYGAPAHGGFGMGLTRVVMLLLDLPNIREASFLFRGPNRLTP